ncbi:MAG: serine/threonine-protein kinase [Candidatus Melainabacteria bacterium]|nr:serine/threonine-protein kinase [Candidatus Melainabacteria bacterium]
MTTKSSAKTAVVNYESPNALVSRKMAVISAACMIVFVPLPLLYPILVPFTQGLPLAILLALSIGAVLFFMVSFNAFRVYRSARLVLTDTGIVLPDKLGSTSREVVPWTKVELIEIANDKQQQEEILFSLKGWVPIRIKTSSLKPEDLDKLVSACELWAAPLAKSDSFKRLVERVTLKRRDNEDTSFTALWMEEAQRRLTTTPFTPLEPGAKLQSGRLQVIQPLTAGGWSAIYLCQWKEKTSCILKEAVVPPAANDSLKAKAYEHFEREAVLLAGLDHPQIANVMDYFIENNRQYMVLERISGANLRTYIRDRGSVSEKQAVKWAEELVKIVSYLHTHEPPIVHRDLTPENLILDMKGSLVLIDFGSANEFVGTVTGTLVGKPSYISPEQFSGHAKPQSDLYSIGAILSFILTAADPEPLTVANPKAINPLISDGLQKLVQDLTVLDARKRIQSAEELAQRLVPLNSSVDQAGLTS